MQNHPGMDRMNDSSRDFYACSAFGIRGELGLQSIKNIF